MFGQTTYPGLGHRRTSPSGEGGTAMPALFDSFALAAAQDKGLTTMIRRDPQGTRQTLQHALGSGYPRAVATTFALPGAIAALVDAGIGDVVPALLDAHPSYRKALLNLPGASKALVNGGFDTQIIAYLTVDPSLSHPLLLQPDVAGDLVYKGHGNTVVGLLADPQYSLATQAAETPSLRLALIYKGQENLLDQLDRAAQTARFAPAPPRFYAQA